MLADRPPAARGRDGRRRGVRGIRTVAVDIDKAPTRRRFSYNACGRTVRGARAPPAGQCRSPGGHLPGLARARGDYVVTLDADLQDPPEVIREMLTIARTEGVDVVRTGCARIRTTDSAFNGGRLAPSIEPNRHCPVSTPRRRGLPTDVTGDRRCRQTPSRSTTASRALRGACPWFPRQIRGTSTGRAGGLARVSTPWLCMLQTLRRLGHRLLAPRRCASRPGWG